MAKREAERYGMAVVEKYRDNAYDIMSKYNLDTRSQWQKDFDQNHADFNNYLNSGNYTTDNNKKYRDMATQAVADLDAQMKRYGSSSNEYKTLKEYKNYYENQLPNFDRMDVGATMRDYLSYDPETYKYQNWHSEEDYNNQKAYIDDKRKALQAEMDELGEAESEDYKILKSWADQYDMLAEALEDRNQYDRQFETPESYAAYERSRDYNNNVQTLKQKDELQAQLAAAEETYKRLQPKFYGLTDLGAITPEEQKEYEDMLNAQQTIAKLKPEVIKITGDLAGMEKYQGDEARSNFYREHGVNGNVQEYVDSLKEAREKAEDLHGKYSTEWAKIDLQIRALAGENEDGTNENKLYDESTPLGRYIMSNFDVAEAEEEIAKIDKQLQDLGAPSNQVTGRLIDKFGVLGAIGASQSNATYFNPTARSAAQVVGEAKALEDDPRVMELRAQKAQWQQKINSSDRLKERNRIDDAYGGLKNKEALAEEGAGLILQDGKGALGHTIYQKPGAAAGENGDLGRYFSYLTDEALAGTDWEDMASSIRSKIYAAIAAENKGVDIGYTVEDVLNAYEGNMAAIAGYLDAKKINDTEGSLGRFLKQEGFLLGGAAWNNLTHVGDMFTDEVKPANRLENMQANVLQNMGEYGGVGGLKVTDERNLAQTIGEATWTTGNMLPSIAASYLMSGGLGLLGAEAATAKTAGKLVGAGMMGLTSGGQAYQQALAEGWSKEDARLYGAIIGAAEVGTQYAIGGITGLGGITEDKLLAMCKGIDHVLPRVIAETSIHIGSEVAEELVQNRIERYLQYDLFREGNEDWMSWTDDDWYTVVVTALSTGAMEGPGTAYSLAMQNRTGKALSGAIIPGKGITKRQQANNAITKAVGEMMQGNEPLAFTLVSIGTNLTEVGSEANEMATKMEEGKLPKNAMNLGELYGLTMAEFQKQDSKNGIDKFMNAMQGGATTYNGIEGAKSTRDAAKAEYETIKSENPGAVVLEQNATALRNLGIPEDNAVEYGAIMNKILSGEKLTDAEADKVSADTKAGQAIRVALANEIGEFDRTASPEMTKATITAVYNEMKLEKQRQQESLRVSVVQAAMNAANQAEVNRATASTDFAKAQWASESQAYGAGSVLDKAVSKQNVTPVRQRVGYHEATQKAVDSKIAQEMQAADQQVRNAERQVQLLEKMSFEEAAKYHFTGLEGVMGDMKTMQDLQTRLATLNEEAKKIRSVHMPSAEQRTRLNDINTERNQIVGQQMALMSKHAANLREGAEKIATEQAAKAQAEAAQNSSAEDTIRLPGIGDKTRSQFVQEYLQRHEGATEAEANEMFEKRAAETGGYVKKGNVENGQNQQNASADEGRNSLGNEADGGENRTGRPGQPTEVQRQRLESSSQLLSRDGEEAARVEKGATQTDGRSLDLLVDKYEGFEDFVQTLYDLGFDRITLITDGQMLDPKGDRIPALFYKGELFLSLDYGEPGKYDYKSYAKHEVGHLKLEQLRRFFGDKKSAWFVSNAVQALTESPEEYASLFKKYANMYRAYKMIDGISDEEFVNMVNEEILCDMLGGLHGLERFIDKADAYLEQSNFNTVTSNIQKGERLPGQLQVVDALKESEMPYNTPVTTLMSTANVDAPNTTVVPADQVSRMAYFGLMNALGFYVNKPEAGQKAEKKAYRTEEDAAARQNEVTTVTVEDIKNSPVGEMIRYAQNNGFLSADPEEAARIAEAEYKLFAGIGSVTEQTNDFYMSMQFIGSALFTAMKTNADKQYNTTYDPASVCTKTQAVLDDMSAQMVDLKRGLYQDEILEIYRSQFEAGNPVPCPECYVFTHWVGIGGLLENIYKYQSKYAELSPEEVVKRYNELFQDVTDDLNSKVKPLKEELSNPNTTPERAEEIKLLLKKNTFGKTRRKLIEQAEKGLKEIQDKLEKGIPLTANEVKNRPMWEKHADNLAALSWIKTVYFGGKEVKAKNANISIDPETGEKKLNFYVPTDILFDLNRGEEFAAQYKDAWAFRTTQGAGYGKAIAPYAEATLGEGILVTKSQDNIKKKMEGALNQLFLTERGEIEGRKRGTRGEALALTREKQLNQLFIGGQRLQSTSDTRYDNASDYLLIALEMQTMHGGVQVYTKVPGAVHFFELCGMCSNMSLMPRGGGLEMIDGELVPVDTSTGGMNPKTAQDLRVENPHAGTITIGVNDRHIRAMMKQFFRDFIIPYHASGGNADLIAKFRAIQEGLDPSKSSMPKSSDYTKTQNDKILSDAILKEDLGYDDTKVAEIHRFREARLYLLTKYANDRKAGREVPAELARMWSVDNISPDDPRYRSRMILQNLYRSMTDGQWQGVKIKKDIVEGQIFPNEFWDTSVNYENSGVNTENYLAYCEALGFLHRFSGQGVAMKKATKADGSFTVRNQIVPIKGKDYDGSEVMLTDLAYQVNADGSYKLDENGERMVEPYFWKVLVDRRMYDNDGNYLPQPYVSLAGLVGNGSAEDINAGVDAVVSKTEGIAHPMGNRPYNRRQSLATAATPVAERQAKRAFRDAITSYAGRDNNQPMTRIQKGQGRYALGMDDAGYETSKREAPVTDERGQVLYVEPTSGSWAVGRDTDGSLLNTDYLKNELGMDIFDNPKDKYAPPEKNSKVIQPKHKTSNPSTEDTYQHFLKYVADQNVPDDVVIVDASSGMGLGSRLLKNKFGEENVIDLEPFPGDTRRDGIQMPDYGPYGSLIYDMEDQSNGKVRKADYIISNAVINVLAQDAREEHLAALLRMLDDNGTIFINPAFASHWTIANTPISLEEYKAMRDRGENVAKKNVMLAPEGEDSGQEVYVAGTKTVQKGYTENEFKAFAKDVAKQALGIDINIEPAKGTGSFKKGYLITKAGKSAPRYALSPEQEKNQQYNNQQTEVGSRLKTLQGTNIQRYKGIAGKEVAPQVYVHKNYAAQVVPEDALNRAEEVLNEKYPDFQYNTIMYDKKTGNVRFDEAPDFDTAREPIAGNTVTVTPDGETKTGYSDAIWHHKWLWVGNDYQGFNVADSWNWSKQWLNTIRPVDVSEHKFNSSFSQRGIANGTGHGTTNWNEQLEYFGLPKDENATPTQTRYSVGDEAAQQNFERLKGALNNVFSTDTSERTDGDGERELAERIERSYSADSITDAEDRRAVAEAIRRAGGLTAEEIDDSWGNVLSTEVVSPEYYTKEMLEIEAANKEHGLQTKFFSGSVTIDGEDLNMAGFADTDRGVAYIKMDAINRGDNDITKNSFIDTAPIAALSGVNSASINGRHERLHLLKDAGDANAQALFDFVNSSKSLDEINFWYQRKLRQGGYGFDDYSEELAADLYAGALKLADKSLQKKADQMIAKIDGSAQTVRYAVGDEEDTTSSNPYPENTLEHDFLSVLQNGDPEALGKWVTEQLDANTQAEENAKIRPPVIPTKGFVPKITPQQKEALETKRKGLIQKKGAMRPSEKNANGFQMPKRDENNNPFRRNIQNVGSAKQIPQDAVDQLENFAFTDIHATYVPDSNKEMIASAKREINETGDLEISKAQFQKMARDSYDHNVSAQDIAFGEQLLIETSRSGDLNGFLDTLASLVEISTTAGKTLQAFRMLKQSGPIGQLYYMEKVVKRLNDNLLKKGYNKQVSIDPDLAQAVLDAETDVERDEALDVLKASIAKDLPVTFKEKLDAWRYLAMLGNARTHIRNVIGNAIFVPLRYTKDVMAAGLEFLGVKTGFMGMTQEDRTKAVRIQKEWRTFAEEQADVWRKELQGNGKYNPAREILEARKVLPGFLDKLSRINSNGIGEGHGVLSKVLVGLEGEDWAFLRPAFTRALAMALQNTGYSIDEIRTSNDKEVRQAYNRAIKIAIEEAQKATYRDFSAAASQINRLKRLETSSKLGRFAGVLLEGVLPFTKTPINILKRGIEYSPIGLAASIANAVDSAIKHNGDATQIIDSIAAGASGSVLMVLGWLLARMGVLRGKRQDDKEEQFEKLQGYQDYSLQFGDTSFTIDWAAPVALPLFTGASLAEFMDNSEDFELADAWNAMMMVAEPMMSLSMLSGLNDTLASASYADDNQKLMTIGKSMLSSYLGQFFPTVSGQLARSIDGTRRQTYVDKNSKIPPAMQRFIQSSIQNKTPVWESQKAPYVDQWGRQSTTSTKLLNAAENFFAPWYRSIINTTDIDEQLQALYDSKDVSEDNHKYILPKSPEKSFKVNGQDKFLTADEYVSFATDVGTTKYKLLTSLLSDVRYLNLTDDQKAKAIKYIYDYATAAGKYHVDNNFDIHRAGKWIEEAEAAKSDYERFEIIWDKIEAAFDK